MLLADTHDDTPPSPDTPTPRRATAVTVALSALVAATVVVAVVRGWDLQANSDVRLGAAPLVGEWRWRIGPALVPAAVLAVAAVIALPRLAGRLPFLRLLVVVGAWAVALTFALAASDGWHAVLAPVVHPTEYWANLSTLSPPAEMLRAWDLEFLLRYSVHVKGTRQASCCSCSGWTPPASVRRGSPARCRSSAQQQRPVLSTMGVVTFAVMPAAPSWLASAWGMLDETARPVGRGWSLISLHTARRCLPLGRVPPRGRPSLVPRRVLPCGRRCGGTRRLRGAEPIGAGVASDGRGSRRPEARSAASASGDGGRQRRTRARSLTCRSAAHALPPPPAKDGWDLRFGTSDASKGWGQYEVTGGGRLWYCIDDAQQGVWVMEATPGHPKATE